MDAAGEPGQPATAHHTDGQPSIRVHRRNWDADKRQAAAQLDMAEPCWAIYYGTGSRLFFAIAAWNVADPLIVEAIDVGELQELMREAEVIGATPTDSRPASAVWL
ncbi:hypothetical protein ACFFHJ_16575 [Planotetraspora thailandica]|nr:hypothetical protein [Planotetraspora thailandica]